MFFVISALLECAITNVAGPARDGINATHECVFVIIDCSIRVIRANQCKYIVIERLNRLAEERVGYIASHR